MLISMSFATDWPIFARLQVGERGWGLRDLQHADADHRPAAARRGAVPGPQVTAGDRRLLHGKRLPRRRRDHRPGPTYNDFDNFRHQFEPPSFARFHQRRHHSVVSRGLPHAALCFSHADWCTFGVCWGQLVSGFYHSTTGHILNKVVVFNIVMSIDYVFNPETPDRATLICGDMAGNATHMKFTKACSVLFATTASSWQEDGRLHVQDCVDAGVEELALARQLHFLGFF